MIRKNSRAARGARLAGALFAIPSTALPHSLFRLTAACYPSRSQDGTMKMKTSSWFTKLPSGHVGVGISRGLPLGYEHLPRYRKLAPGSSHGRRRRNTGSLLHGDFWASRIPPKWWPTCSASPRRQNVMPPSRACSASSIHHRVVLVPSSLGIGLAVRRTRSGRSGASRRERRSRLDAP